MVRVQRNQIAKVYFAVSNTAIFAFVYFYSPAADLPLTPTDFNQAVCFPSTTDSY